MKSYFVRSAVFALAAAAPFAFTSCATTGDPSTGGIFWSENKAQDRLAERQNRLENIESRTNSTNRKSAETQRQIDALR
jgi:outer membrane lipoprotein-sorting protein